MAETPGSPVPLAVELQAALMQNYLSLKKESDINKVEGTFQQVYQSRLQDCQLNQEF